MSVQLRLNIHDTGETAIKIGQFFFLSQETGTVYIPCFLSLRCNISRWSSLVLNTKSDSVDHLAELSGCSDVAALNIQTDVFLSVSVAAKLALNKPTHQEAEAWTDMMQFKKTEIPYRVK